MSGDGYFAAHAPEKVERRFKGLGVAEGWRCLLVAARRGSIAQWLADRASARPGESLCLIVISVFSASWRSQGFRFASTTSRGIRSTTIWSTPRQRASGKSPSPRVG